jgi:hypothetical protein
VDVEVGVHAEVSATLGFMQSAAIEIGIGDESLDAGQLLLKAEESLAAKLQRIAYRLIG